MSASINEATCYWPLFDRGKDTEENVMEEKKKRVTKQGTGAEVMSDWHLVQAKAMQHISILYLGQVMLVDIIYVVVLIWRPSHMLILWRSDIELK